MSQMMTRKMSVGEDKDKQRQTDSPAKEVKKKTAANAEKEKHSVGKNIEKATNKHNAEATDKTSDKKDKPVEKQSDKTDKKDKSNEKKDKTTEKKDKSAQKKDKSTDKHVEKKNVEKNVEKSKEKSTDEKEKVDKNETVEKPKEESTGSTSTNKAEKETRDEIALKAATACQNGDAANGNGTASCSEDEELVIVEQELDEMFPELAYDDNSDADVCESEAAGRSVTRRSQVKVTRTPETPQPASVKQTDKQVEVEDTKEPKILKLKGDLCDRILRSAGTPKPIETETQEKESPKKEDNNLKNIDSATESKQPETPLVAEDKQEPAKSNKIETEVLMEVESSEEVSELGGELARRDTRYSQSRIKVSPYRRNTRLADITASSTLANYTGNNTTMEMDITTASVFSEEPSSLEDSYLSGLRNIRGRRSYKPLKEMALRNIIPNISQQSVASTSARESAARPMSAVVGRKRRPDAEQEGGGSEPHDTHEPPKRARLLDRLARPFRTHSAQLPTRRAAEIVGINTDLPLTAPVAASDSFDPEAIKPTPATTSTPLQKPTPLLAPAPIRTPAVDRDNKRCVVM